MQVPKLIPVDLSKASNHEHPGIRTDGTRYLCKNHGVWFVGTFSKQWFGLSCTPAWSSASFQFDAPGFNLSVWEAVFELVE